MTEPRLSPDDIEAWGIWQRAAATHAKTMVFARRVESSHRLLDQWLIPNASVSWSGGKDSTVMTHLVAVEHGAPVTVVSEKDDLDFPGEEEYVRRLGAKWKLNLRVVHPSVSPSQWIADHASEMMAGDEIHARAAGLSKACFYRVIEEATAEFDCVMLGLRSEESGMRRILRQTKGRAYDLKSGVRRILPIADWRGIDVYAYAVSRGIELLPVYRCIAFMHRDDPARVRKSWWLPGGNSRFGQIAWLRRYYPSLHSQLCHWLPDARLLG